MNDQKKCTAAIAGQDANGGWRLIGGGVCIRVGPRAFLLSAGHVLAAVTQKAWLGMAGRIVPLYGAAVLDGGPKAPPEARALNIGFAPLMLHEMASAALLDCITLDAVDLEDDQRGEEYVAIAPVDASAADWRGIPARGAPQAAYRSCGVDVATHVVVDADGRVEPEGVVGCGIWRRRDEPAGPLLTGIVVEVRPIDGGARTRVVATRAPFAVLGIFGFLGVRPTRGGLRAGAGPSPRRTH